MPNGGYLWVVRLPTICVLMCMSFLFFHIKHAWSLIKEGQLSVTDTI